MVLLKISLLKVKNFRWTLEVQSIQIIHLLHEKCSKCITKNSFESLSRGVLKILKRRVRDWSDHFFFHQDAKLLRTQPPFRNPPLLDQHWVTLGWRDVRRQFFAPPSVWVVANIQGRCETKVVCKASPLNTPISVYKYLMLCC